MNKIEIFTQMVRDYSLQLHMPPAQHLKVVSFIMLNYRHLTNYIESTDISMEDLVTSYIQFAYMNGPKPQFLINNGL